MDELLRTLSLTRADAYMIPVGTILFFLLWRLLDVTLFGPYLQLAEMRERMTTGAFADAEAMEREAAERNGESDARTFEARVAFVKTKMERVNESRREAQAIVEQAERAAAEQLKSSRVALKEEIDTLRRENLGRAELLASELTQQVLRPSRMV
jgi:F0F1-type ATP synthase membrane subunit b/b'